MISIEESFPYKSENYLKGQDIIWSQFNDINFYVEDKDQENFYFQVLKKLFPNIKFERIFPLCGKDNIILDAKENISNKKNIYLVDLDFDQILNKKEDLKNVFYLNRYSIENYLLEEKAIYEVIKEEKPKIKDAEIKNKFCYSSFLTECISILRDLACNFLLIKKFQLGIVYHKLNPPRDCDFTSRPSCLHERFINPFYVSVKATLKTKYPKLKYETQIRKLRKHFQNVADLIKNVPGKYILNILKYKYEKAFCSTQISLESFTYRVAKNCELFELNFLKMEIEDYLR